MAEINWHIGCSGFYYREWKELFYPKGLAQARWFDYYATQFSTLEINNTFYRFPEEKTLRNWYNKAPEEFRFAIKVPQEITHQRRFSGTADLLRAFYDVAGSGLEEKLGPVLFQLPPSMAYSPERLELILSQLDLHQNNVIEFRHATWWRKEVQEELGRRKVTFCGASYPGLDDAAVVNTPSPYYRFHGVPKLYYSAYEPSFLEQIASSIEGQPDVTSAWIYFNNTAAAAALDNGRWLQERVARS